jgi:hypothetical protein
MHRMGREARQRAVELVIDSDDREIGFRLKDLPPSRHRKGKKRRG